MLSCADLARSLAFYGGLLGGVETYRFPEEGEAAFVTLAFADGSLVGLGPVTPQPLHGRAQRPASGHRVELCVYVDDVDRAAASAREAGFEVAAEPQDMPWGERVAWVVDPDGTLVMLTR